MPDPTETKQQVPKRPRGRPAFQPTPALRKRVAELAGGGWLHENIALALDISDRTLRKYFAHELAVGAYQVRASIMQALAKAAKKGNVSAAKTYLLLAPALAAPPHRAEATPTAPGAQAGATPAAPEPNPAGSGGAPLGKKEQAQLDAKTAGDGTEWAGLLRPGSAPLQ